MTKVVLALGVSLGALALAACDSPTAQETASETGVPATIVEAPAAQPVEAETVVPEAASEEATSTSDTVEDLPDTAEEVAPPSN